MKTLLLTVCFAVATALHASDAAERMDQPKELKSRDGRVAMFRVMMASDDGLGVVRAETKGASPVLVLRWDDLDLAHLKAKQPALHAMYLRRATLGGGLNQRSASGLFGTTQKAGDPAILPPGSIRIFARLDTDKFREYYRWTTSWGSYIKDQIGSRALYVKLHRMAGPTEAVQVKVETFFLTGFAPKYKIVDRKVEDLSLTMVGDVELYPLCGFENTQSRFVALGQRDFDGKPKPTSWAVRIVQQGRVIASASSLYEVGKWLEGVAP